MRCDAYSGSSNDEEKDGPSKIEEISTGHANKHDSGRKEVTAESSGNEEMEVMKFHCFPVSAHRETVKLRIPGQDRPRRL